MERDLLNGSSKRFATVARISDSIDRSYLLSGRWRCACSPSGAHHWFVDDEGAGKCKYCGEERQFTKIIISNYARLSDVQLEPDPLSEEAFREHLSASGDEQKYWFNS